MRTSRELSKKESSEHCSHFIEKIISISLSIRRNPHTAAHACISRCTVPCCPANYPHLDPMVIGIMDRGALLAQPSLISLAMRGRHSALTIKIAPCPACTLRSC